VFDLTLKIDERMPVWPGDPRPVQTWLQRIARGDPVDLSQWTLGSHTGTHVDAPSHFIANASDLEALGLEPFVGPCRVIDLEQLRALEPATLGIERVLIKISHGQHAVDPELATRLVVAGVRLVGVDALSIEPLQAVSAGAPTHRTLLAAGVVILEGLVLHAVPPGDYFLVAAPLRLQHSEASPVRAILLQPVHDRL
jgi:arylformamidase